MGQLLTSSLDSPDVAPQSRPDECQALYKFLGDLEKECNTLLKTVSNVRKNGLSAQDNRKYVNSILKETMQRLGLQLSSSKQDKKPTQPVRHLPPQKETAIDRQTPVLLQEKHDLQKTLQEMTRRRREDDDKVKKWEQKVNELKTENDMFKKVLDESSQRCQKAEQEKEQALVRLSKLMSDRLLDRNPEIADLSDPNRPTKLGEVYSELYDNEWTDAFEALTKSGYTDEYAIETLRLTLMNCWDFSKEMSVQMVHKLEETLQNLFGMFEDNHAQQKLVATTTNLKFKVPDQSTHMSSLKGGFKLHARWKPKQTSSDQSLSDARVMTMIRPLDLESKLQDERKEVAVLLVPFVQKAYLKSLVDPSGLLPEMKPFIKKCLFVTWMMAVQTPPMWLDGDTTSGKPFDGKSYKEFEKRGPTVAFVVWPAVRLHNHGPLIGKGVAKGMDG